MYANRSSLGTGVREIAQRAARASQLLEQETKALMTWLQAKGCGVERSAAGAPRRPGHDQAPGGGRGAAALDLLLYRTRFLGHTFTLRGLTQLVFLARFERRAIRQLLEAPALIVAFDEPGDGGAHVGQVSKDPASVYRQK